MTLENIVLVFKLVAGIIALGCLVAVMTKFCKINMEDDLTVKKLNEMSKELKDLKQENKELRECIDDIYDACEKFYDEEYLPFVESCERTSTEEE